MELNRIFINLDVEQLRRLLLAVRGDLDESYDVSDVEDHCAAVAKLRDVDDDAMMEPFVVYQGEPSPMIVDTFRKRHDEFEVVFMVSANLVELIKTHAKNACDTVPHRIL